MATEERAYLHTLVDQLPADLVAPTTELLKRLAKETDPVAQALAEAPLDDEPYTKEERQLVTEAWEDVKKGHVVSSEELDREFGW